MTKVTKYAHPLPAVTDAAVDEDNWCPGVNGGWVCTRPKDHEGDHEAGVTGGKKAASWPRKVR